jgi:hypothetical protein
MDLGQKKASRRMFYAIEINLILWAAAFGGSFQDGSTASGNWPTGRVVALVGFGFAAIAQHVAYYSLYRAGSSS